MRRHTRRAVTVPLAAVALLVIGCSGGESEPEASSPTRVPDCREGMDVTAELGQSGCKQSDGALAAAFSYECADGGEFVLFGDDYWGLVGSSMSTGTGPEGEAAREACLQAEAGGSSSTTEPVSPTTLAADGPATTEEPSSGLEGVAACTDLAPGVDIADFSDGCARGDTLVAALGYECEASGRELVYLAPDEDGGLIFYGVPGDAAAQGNTSEDFFAFMETC